ncbi:MAG: plasmid mobilization protein [Acutalibacteraceae bacterium]
MEQTRNKIISIASKCGLTLSEYIRQVCLGYEPKEIFRRYQ